MQTPSNSLLTTLLQSARLAEGAAYVEDFAGNVSVPADIRVEPDGTISIRAGGGYNFHFWPETGRVALDPADIGGIFTTVQARLIMDNPARPDDRDHARYLLSVGADYWLRLDSEWDYFETNGDVGIGRFRYVTSEWQSFNMTLWLPPCCAPIRPPCGSPPMILYP
jgi:hypothetical protein